MERLQAARKRFRHRFWKKKHDKTWINAGLTPDVMVEPQGGEEVSQKCVDQGVSLALGRIQAGQCPFCGNQLHQRRVFGGWKALTVGGLAMNGHCLQCFPITAFTERNKPGTPKTVDSEDGNPLDEKKMMLSIDPDRLSHVSELSGSFYCDIHKLTWRRRKARKYAFLDGLPIWSSDVCLWLQGPSTLAITPNRTIRRVDSQDYSLIASIEGTHCVQTCNTNLLCGLAEELESETKFWKKRRS